MIFHVIVVSVVSGVPAEADEYTMIYGSNGVVRTFMKSALLLLESLYQGARSPNSCFN